MDKFERGGAPLCLSEAAQKGNSWATLNRDCYVKTRQALFYCSGDTCAYCGSRTNISSRETVDHFQPKGKFPNMELEWSNLFPCCDKCQSCKLEQWSEKVLKPDAHKYEPAAFFILNVDGELQALNDKCTESVLITVNTFGLNRPKLAKARKDAVRRFMLDPENELQDEYRFLRELIA